MEWVFNGVTLLCLTSRTGMNVFCFFLFTGICPVRDWSGDDIAGSLQWALDASRRPVSTLPDRLRHHRQGAVKQNKQEKGRAHWERSLMKTTGDAVLQTEEMHSLTDLDSFKKCFGILDTAVRDAVGRRLAGARPHQRDGEHALSRRRREGAHANGVSSVLDAEQNVFQRNEYQVLKTGSLLDTYLDGLTPSQLLRLYHVYELDFRLFDYHTDRLVEQQQPTWPNPPSSSTPKGSLSFSFYRSASRRHCGLEESLFVFSCFLFSCCFELRSLYHMSYIPTFFVRLLRLVGGPYARWRSMHLCGKGR